MGIGAALCRLAFRRCASAAAAHESHRSLAPPDHAVIQAPDRQTSERTRATSRTRRRATTKVCSVHQRDRAPIRHVIRVTKFRLRADLPSQRRTVRIAMGARVGREIPSQQSRHDRHRTLLLCRRPSVAQLLVDRGIRSRGLARAAALGSEQHARARSSRHAPTGQDRRTRKGRTRLPPPRDDVAAGPAEDLVSLRRHTRVRGNL